MKKILIILLASILPLAASAQTIHWLTFIDTTDENVGHLDVQGRKVLYNRFINVVNAALAEKGYKANIQDIYDKALTPQKCKAIVTGLNSGPNDIIVFYYIGHGTHGVAGGDVWPMMLMGQNNPDYLIPLKWVHDELKAKGSRLTVSIGMCCNSIQGVKRLDAPTFSVNYGNTYLNDVEKTAIQNMFLERKGDFLLSSASPNQSSVGRMTPLGPMDLFTCVLVMNFEANASQGDLDWTSLFNDVRASVNANTGGTQTPIFVSNITKAAAPSRSTPAPRPVAVTPPAPKPTNASSTAKTSGDVPNQNGQEKLNQLAEALDNLINVRQSEEGRIQQASELEKIFSPNAVVKMLSQDGDIVVNKSSAHAFTGRLATSRILLKVVPVSIKWNDKNKIAELQVKEVYKK